MRVKNIYTIKCISEWENVAGYKSQMYTVPSAYHRGSFGTHKAPDWVRGVTQPFLVPEFLD